jgi:hypothetical protein
LQDAVNAAFEVALEDGEVVRVPAGRALEIAGGDYLEREGGAPLIARYLDRTFPWRAHDAAPDPFGWQRGWCGALRAGDRVELWGSLSRIEDPLDSGGPRRPAAAILSPDGPLVVKKAP